MFGLPLLPRSLSAALRDLTSSRPDIRRAALVDLARYSDSPERQTVLDAVASLLLTDPDPELRANAALVVADANLAELVPEILRALRDSSPRVQQMALLAVAEIGESTTMQAREAVAPLLKSSLPALRYQSLVAWRAMFGAEALDRLVLALGDEDEEVRWVAASLIEEQLVRPRSARERDAGTPSALASVPEVPSLVAALSRTAEDPAWRIRVIAASVLCALGEPLRLARQLDQLEGPNAPTIAVRLSLIARFGWLKFHPARSYLSRHARRGWFEGPLGWPALVALAALGDGAAEASIVEEVSAGSVRRCRRAIEAVRELQLVAAVDSIRALRHRASGIDDWLIADTLQVLCGKKDGP